MDLWECDRGRVEQSSIGKVDFLHPSQVSTRLDFLQIQCSKEEQWFRHGYLSAPEIYEAIRVRLGIWKHITAQERSWLVEKARGTFIAKINPENPRIGDSFNPKS